MASIFDIILSGTIGSAQAWCLPNIKGEGRERWISATDAEKLERFAKKHDGPGFGIFFAVSTIEADKPRKKEFARNLPFLFADIDAKDHDIPIDQIVDILMKLDCPPTRIHHTGRGLHVFWVLDVPVELPEGMERAEDLLRRLADHLGGDRQVAHCVALLRLPGTHNTKRGERRPVRVLKEGNRRYSLDEIMNWLDAQPRPALVRRARQVEAGNPFLNIYRSLGYKPPVNVAERLQQMEVGGDDEASVHNTQLSVTGAMVAAGIPEDEIVSRVLTRTQELRGTQNWNWRTEERTIRGMIRDMKRKIDADRRRPKSLSAAAPPPDGDSTVSLHDATAKIGDNSKNEMPLWVKVSDVWIEHAKQNGKSLKWVPDAEGNRHFWKCEEGLWRLLPTDADVLKWLEGDLRSIVEGIGHRKKTAAKLFSEAAKCIMRWLVLVG